MSTPMVRTPQLVFQVCCACGENNRNGFKSYPEAIATRDALQNVGDCICKGSMWRVDWYTEWLPDPIATVRQVHPYAFALPPCPANGRPNWSVYPHAEWPPDSIAEGPTEAAAWLAAAERVCA